MFDFANTSFSVMIVTVGYTLYFKTVVAGGGGHGDFLWGTSVSISMLITALISPLLGAVADFTTNRKFFLLIFTLASIVCTACMYFITAGMIIPGMILFIIANVGFEGGIVFYDSFLVDLTEGSHVGRVSGYGFAMGYLGALVTLIIAMPLYDGGFTPENLINVRFSFLIGAMMFLIFSLPMFLGVREGHRTPEHTESFLRAGYRRLKDTLTHIRRYRNVARFLLAFFLYNDGILTVIAFASIFAQDTLHFTISEIVLFFAIVQSAGIIGSVVFGVITDKIGPKKTITITLIMWVSIIIASYFTTTATMYYIIGIFAGTAIGSTQSASRSLMTLITPGEKKTEFFGFYDGFFGKASAVIGVFLFGLISEALQSQRIAILSIGFFFVTGLILLQQVKENIEEVQ